jgi:hypothetical protein
VNQNGPLTLYVRECLTPPQARDLKPEPAADSLAAFWLAQAEWSQATFGPDATPGGQGKGPLGALKHLEKETREAWNELDDARFYAMLAETVDCEHGREFYASMAERRRRKALVELADCVSLVFDAARRAGFTFDQLVKACWDKLALNKTRTWPAPESGDEPVEHDRSAEALAQAQERR